MNQKSISFEEPIELNADERQPVSARTGPVPGISVAVQTAHFSCGIPHDDFLIPLVAETVAVAACVAVAERVADDAASALVSGPAAHAFAAVAPTVHIGATDETSCALEGAVLRGKVAARLRSGVRFRKV